MKSELSTLRTFHEEHKHCQIEENNRRTALKEGSGCCDPCDSGLQSSSSQCKDDDSYNPNLNVILNQEAPLVPLTTKSTKPDENLPIQHDLILSKIWKKYIPKAKKLLKTLEESGRFHVDKMSMVKIDGLPLHVSIFNLMKECFHSKVRAANTLQPFVNLVMELNLQQYIVNKYFLIKDDEEASEYWYFIGN